MSALDKFLPDPEMLLALEPEDLAGYLLEYLNNLPSSELANLNRYNFISHERVQNYPPRHQQTILSALMEAWVWLEREGLLIPKPGAQGDWREISRRGKAFKNHNDVE